MKEGRQYWQPPRLNKKKEKKERNIVGILFGQCFLSSVKNLGGGGANCFAFQSQRKCPPYGTNLFLRV